MTGEQLALAGLLAATTLHTGFQLTVTTLVYPALGRTGDGRWAEAHARHSRGITPLVVLCYGTWVLAAAAVLVLAPRTPSVLLSVVAGLVPLVLTALWAAPLHGRLGREGPQPPLVALLLHVDRLRLLATTVALVVTLVAVVRS